MRVSFLVPSLRSPPLTPPSALQTSPPCRGPWTLAPKPPATSAHLGGGGAGRVVGRGFWLLISDPTSSNSCDFFLLIPECKKTMTH